MQAVVYSRYGSAAVLQLAEVEQPIPGEDEILIKVYATTVTRADCATREANRRSGLVVSLLSRLVSGLGRLRQPIPGSELAGTVQAVGTAVRTFAVGDPVFGSAGFRFGAPASCTSQRL